MVSTKRLISALEKAGYRVEHKLGFYTCKSNTRKLRWFDQEGTAKCINSQKLEERNQSEIDYFPGWFCHSIKDAINSMQ